jgi:hypothetical protein
MTMKRTSALDSMEWTAFVPYVAEKFRNGQSDREVSARLAGMRVEWAGIVQELRRRGSEIWSIAVDMPRISIPLGNGNSFEGDFVSLPVKDAQLEAKAHSLSPGDKIAFSATIVQNDGLFPSVGFVIDEEQRMVFLKIGLEKVEID